MSIGQPLRYIWVYSAADEWTVAWHERQRKRRLALGYDVTYFCDTPTSLKRRWLPFPELHRRWRTGDPALMDMYEALTDQLADRDVLINYNGANLHPDFVEMLGLVKVYTAGDPESAPILSYPNSPPFDIHLVNHTNDVARFKEWGRKRVHFWPLGSQMDESDLADLTDEQIADIRTRPRSVVMLCEYSHWRRAQLDQLQNAFPDALCAGRGWPRGFLPWPELWAAYRQAQIGWNVHNTTGFNFRTYELAAHGAMQICDNKSTLHHVFEPGTEIIGFDTIDECIEQTRYFLARPHEQREIALRAHRRWRREYSPDRVWEKLVAIVQSHPDVVAARQLVDVGRVKDKLRRHARRGRLQAPFVNGRHFAMHFASRVARRLVRPFRQRRKPSEQ